MNKGQRRTRIKFCGITSIVDAQQAVRLGVDAIGLMFYEKSSRLVTIEQAQQIAQHISAFVTSVGVFADADVQYVKQVLTTVPLTCLQFHGNESEAYCQHFALPYIKVIRMQAGLDVLAAIKNYPSASAIILDTYQQQQIGGTGKAFDWQLIPDNINKPLILAGGLTVDNVGQAIQQVNPYGLDLSSSIEFAPGKKDLQKMQQFVAAVNSADQLRDYP